MDKSLFGTDSAPSDYRYPRIFQECFRKAATNSGNRMFSRHPRPPNRRDDSVVRAEWSCLLPLGAYTEEGYELRASFALFRKALDYFAESGLNYANLGAGAGLGSSAGDGLTRFKRGWSSCVRTAFICGRIFDREEYDRLARLRGVEDTDYFPAYRSGEFN